MNKPEIGSMVVVDVANGLDPSHQSMSRLLLGNTG